MIHSVLIKIHQLLFVKTNIPDKRLCFVNIEELL